MQLIPLNNSDISHSHGKILHIQDTYKFTVSIDSQRRGNSILPLYYLCCERRLAHSILYITLVLDENNVNCFEEFNHKLIDSVEQTYSSAAECTDKFKCKSGASSMIVSWLHFMTSREEFLDALKCDVAVILLLLKLHQCPQKKKILSGMPLVMFLLLLSKSTRDNHLNLQLFCRISQRYGYHWWRKFIFGVYNWMGSQGEQSRSIWGTM